MRALGAMLVAMAGVLVGLLSRRRLWTVVQTRDQLHHMLTLMAFELGRFQRPLPELFQTLGQTLEGGAGALCCQVRCAMEEGLLFSQAWSEALGEMDAREREILIPLGAVLGRYGTDEQLTGVELCRREMEQALEQARQTLRDKGRIYVGLSAVGGLMLAVLLM